MSIRIVFLIVTYLVLGLLINGCTSYHPLAVRTSASAYPSITPTLVNEQPVLETAEFNVYEIVAAPGRYLVVPTSLALIEAERGTLLAAGLERNDGNHLIFVSVLGPPVDLLNSAKTKLEQLALKVVSLEYYPIDRLSIRPLTDPLMPGVIEYTALAAPGLTLTPFHILFIVQANELANIIAMKKLLKLNDGLLIEGTYVLNVRGPEGDIKKAQTIKAKIGNAEITSLSM